jgi:hypothetical protein
MSDVISRVELHSASYSDYENLHMYMQQRGYSRSIRGNDGNTYQLPTGTYVGSGTASTDIALQAAVAAATATGKRFSVIVADWNSSRWQGLPVV